jgi:mannose-6-phosphate isomerase-like protein (cupin superfamily)
MADAVKDTVEGEGYAVSHLDGLGEGFGFRKVRGPLGVTAFGVNAIVMPPDYAAPPHKHERQEELYFVHSGTMAIKFGDGSEHVLEAGGVARVAPDTPRQIRNAGEGELVFLAVGGADGYVGRDGVTVDD